MLNYLYDMPEEFKTELGKNFCAMKYVHSLSEKKRRKVIKKAADMNPEQLRSFVSELGSHII